MIRAWAVPTGSLILGLAAYGFLVIAARELQPVDYAAVAALWALVFALAPGLFLPVEQEVARQLARRDDAAPAAAALLRSVTICTATGLLLLFLCTLPWLPELVSRGFDGSTLLLAGLGLALVGYAVLHVLRGVLLARGQLSRYGASLAAEGVLRLCAAGLLALLATGTAGPYGIALAAPPLLVALALLPGCASRVPVAPKQGAAVPVAALLRTLFLLVVASVLSLGLLNAGPLVVKLMAGPDEAEQAGQLLTGLVLARLPVFAFPTLQAALLPRFAALASAADAARLRSLVVRVLAVAMAGTALATLVVGFAGPAAIDIAFGPELSLPARDLVLLAAASCGHLLALLLGLVLVARGRSAVLAATWCLSAGLALVAGLLIESLLLRVEVALLVGAWTAVACTAWAATRQARDQLAEAPAVILPSQP